MQTVRVQVGTILELDPDPVPSQNQLHGSRSSSSMDPGSGLLSIYMVPLCGFGRTIGVLPQCSHRESSSILRWRKKNPFLLFIFLLLISSSSSSFSSTQKSPNLSYPKNKNLRLNFPNPTEAKMPKTSSRKRKIPPGRSSQLTQQPALELKNLIVIATILNLTLVSIANYVRDSHKIEVTILMKNPVG